MTLASLKKYYRERLFEENKAKILSLALAVILSFLALYKLEVKEFLVIILTGLSTLLFSYVVISTGINKKWIFLLSVVLLILSSALAKYYPEYNLYQKSRLEMDQAANRDRYLRIGLIGQVYGRKVGNYYFRVIKFKLDKSLRKMAIPLDLSRYFSSDPSRLYSYLFFLPFLLGLVYVIRYKIGYLFVYLTYSAVSTLLVFSHQSHILYLPFFSGMIALGIVLLGKFIYRKL